MWGRGAEQMSDFAEATRSYFKSKKRQFWKRLKLTALLAFSTSLILVGLSIYLGQLLAPLFLFGGILGLVIWWLRKSHIGDFADLVEYIKGIIRNLLNRITEKEKTLKETTSDPATFTLLQLLTQTNDEERQALERFSGILFESAEKFDIAVRKKSTNDIVSLFKRVRGVDGVLSMATYSEMLDLVGDKFKFKRDGRSDQEFESQLVKIAFEKMVGAMEEKDRQLLEHEISIYAEKHLGKKSLGLSLTSGGLLTANLGGFATYTMASSSLAGIGGAFGISLPFAAYTTLSSTLSVALGPIGLGMLGVWGLHKITSPNLKTTILVVLAVAAVRERLIFEESLQKERLQNEIDELYSQKVELEELLSKLEISRDPETVFASLSSQGVKGAIEHRQ
jgi:uncharacterized protein YaaW (UPF0174 family)